jgi:NADH-quinone oxidoreductase subunit J
MTARILTLLLGAMIVLGLGLTATPVVAQPAADAPSTVDRPRVETPRSATTAGKFNGDRDSKFGPSRGKRGGPVAFMFWAIAALTVAGSLFVVTRKNLITAVMGMVGTFFGIAALYMMLYASFLAIIQMLVYAGAIMVLFVFVIMILNKPEDEPYGAPGKFGKVLAAVAIAYLVFRIGAVLIDVTPPSPVAIEKPPVTAEGYTWGSTASVGWNLFNDYLFPFEAVSLLLLVAVVGAIAIARPLRDDVIGDDVDGHAGDGASPVPTTGGHP